MWFTESPVVKRRIRSLVAVGGSGQTSKKNLQSEAGYTFVEVLVALVIASIILIPLYRSLDNYLSERLIPSLKDSPRHKIELILAGEKGGELPPISRVQGATVQSLLINGQAVLKVTFRDCPQPLYILNHQSAASGQ